MTLEEESERATLLLKELVVEKVARNKTNEVLIQFTDGSRLHIDRIDDTIEMSIEGGIPEAPQV